jgi:hypothetical protein
VDLHATGPESTSWKVAVQTPHGTRGYGVLLAEAGRRWRARIVTFPNVMWTVPGGGGSLKFLARSRREAERAAINFVRRHCVDRGYVMRDELRPVFESGTRRQAQGDRSGAQPAPRFHRDLPVRFGRNRPTVTASTINLSASGLFIFTEHPLPVGELLGLLLELEHCKVPLRGSVVWERRLSEPGRPPGMGLRLLNPPTVYLRYVQALGS